MRNGIGAVASRNVIHVAAALWWSVGLVLAGPLPCPRDLADPFVPDAVMPRGPHAGKCLDTSEQRSIRTLTVPEAAIYGLAPDSTRLVIANLRHAGRFWIAEIRPDAIEDVILQLEYFPAIVPAAHTQLRFRFRAGAGPRLVSQIGAREDSARIQDLVYSVEAVSIVDGEAYDLLKGTAAQFGTAYRFVSLQDRYRQMVTRAHHRVEQIRLKLAPEQRKGVLARAIQDSDRAQMKRVYHTLALNCTTELIRAIDRGIHPDLGYRALAASTFYINGIPTLCKGALALRGLIDRERGGRLADLDREGFEDTVPRGATTLP